MLKHYELTNFKAFGKTQVIPLRPITLVYGPNSSGKSSIFQSLLLLKQTLEDPESLDTILLPQGKLTNLGNYREFIHNHDLDSQFSVKAIFDLEYQSSPRENSFESEAEDLEKSHLGLGVHFAYNQETASPLLVGIDIFQGEERSPLVSYSIEEDSSSLCLSKIYSEHSFWQNWWSSFREKLQVTLFDQANRATDNYDRLKRFRSQKKQISTSLQKQLAPLKKELEEVDPDQKTESLEDCIDEMESLIALEQRFKNYTLPQALEDILEYVSYHSYLEAQQFLPNTLILNEDDELLQYQWEVRHFLQIHKSLGTLEELNKSMENASRELQEFLADLIYIAPLRDYPERLYTFSGHVTEQVGKTGKGIADLLFKRENVLENLNKKFEDFDLRYRVKMVKFLNEDDHQISDIFTIRLVDQVTGIDVSLLDVGFGISQILPVLVQSVASEKKTIIIEQPEIHLHPRLQAELADVFIESALGNTQNTFVIETHSENLLLRIMRRMRETHSNTLPEGYIPVTPDDICVLYVDSAGGASIIQEMPLNRRGELVKAWPSGFFEEGLEEVFA